VSLHYRVCCALVCQVITKSGITYKNTAWHRDCFTCTHCSKTLAGEKFTSQDDQPYCAECYGELFAKKCDNCLKPITGILRAASSDRPFSRRRRCQCCRHQCSFSAHNHLKQVAQISQCRMLNIKRIMLMQITLFIVRLVLFQDVWVVLRLRKLFYDTIRYDRWFALENWQAGCQFYLAHELKEN